jgi:putative transposase
MKKLNSNEIISKNRRKYYLKIHLVLVTKYRKSILINDFNNFIKEKIKEISLKYSFKIDLINSDKNHIHILISFTPNLTVSSIVRVIKQESTVISWKHYNNYLKNYYYKEKTLWSDGYFVSSVGYIDENTVKNYVKVYC